MKFPGRKKIRNPGGAIRNAGFIYPDHLRGPLLSCNTHTTFYNFAERISFDGHGKLAAESSKFDLTLSRANRAQFVRFEILKKSWTF